MFLTLSYHTIQGAASLTVAFEAEKHCTYNLPSPPSGPLSLSSFSSPSCPPLTPPSHAFSLLPSLSFFSSSSLVSFLFPTSLHLNTCRCHIVDEFNRGIYDYIIATDEIPERQPTVSGSKQQPRKRKKDKEYSVARGIDFQGLH